MRLYIKITILTINLVFAGVFTLTAQGHNKKLTLKAENQLKKWKNPFSQWQHLGKIKIDSVSVIEKSKDVEIYFSKPLSYMPVREESIKELKTSITKVLSGKFKAYHPKIFTGKYKYDQLLPNYYKTNSAIDSSRLFSNSENKDFIEREGMIKSAKGLYKNHFALWHSHGWYYESELDRWEWQRARLYGTVEDISPMAYVLLYLVPMLENAGAQVYLPRERDIQKNEVIVDDGISSGKSEFILHKNTETLKKEIGFLKKDTLFPGENPFKLDVSLLTVNKDTTLIATYIPEIPEKGEYAVYISYQRQEKNTKAFYTIYHMGGKTTFKVNQAMGGPTWNYLGSFPFEKGKNAKSGKVEVSIKDGTVSLDAIKFGGGMGNVARRPSEELLPKQWSLKTAQKENLKGKKVNPEDYSWKTSGKARYLEGARYWLQYAGMPDTLVFSLNDEKNDYNDDYQSRGEWVNYLMGTPNGPTGNRDERGLKIPIDLALAFHTDAGVTKDSSTIGTLGIYSSVRDSGIFPNDKSKLASRDLTDLIQTQIVEDIKKLHNKSWTRRGMWDRQYSEAWRPNVPTMLLELLSHQNLADMRFGLDPRFQFDVCRAIYKGILKFQAFQEGREFVVQPLSVKHMAIKSLSKKEFELSWQPVIDPLEPSAEATKYKVYKRINDNGFDNGILTENSNFKFSIDKPEMIVSFKVTAINKGGESMPSEILSAGISSKSQSTVLIVNAFDRICGPATIDENDFAGIAWWDDKGVADKKNIAYVGEQYDFDRKSPWLDDDSPGWGSSHGNMEGKVIPGNTFDFTYTHGEAILKSGYSFVSVSDEAFNSSYNSSSFKLLDIIFGEEKMTQHHTETSKFDFKIFTKPFMTKIKSLTEHGCNIFISGAYIGTDFTVTNDTIAQSFASNILHYKWRTNHAVKIGKAYTTDFVSAHFKGNYHFNTSYHPSIYEVEAPDAIEPVGDGSLTAFRYSENNSSAGVVYNGSYKTVVLGFPFETIIDKHERHQLMQTILNYFTKDKK